MDTLELFQRLSVALAIGLLIGIERGWQERGAREGERTAGLRTHALAAVLGGIWAAVALALEQGGGFVLGAAFLAVSAAIILFRYRETGHDGTFGMTTVVAGMLAFALGAYAVLGDIEVAAATGIAVTGLLWLKNGLHEWVRRISPAELRSALLLLAMTFVLLPLLPNRVIDPWQAINPFEIWLLTVMIAVISFAGYLAIRFSGARRGIIMSALAGGVVSSTAVTLTLSRLAREHPARQRSLVAGVLIAGATMLLRVLVVVGLINAALLLDIAAPIGVACAVFAIGALVLLWRQQHENGESNGLDLENPLDLATVLKFGALLAVVTALAKILSGAVGKWGLFALAAASGIADVDAITLSMARLGSGEVGHEAAATAILIVVAVNSIAKAILAWIAGGPSIGRPAALATAAALLAGALSLVLV